MVKCNICGSSEFVDFNGRKNVKCKNCGSLERHRSLFHIISTLDLMNNKLIKFIRILHLAPEKCIYDYMYNAFGGAYIACDPQPDIYPHAKCLNISFPDGFRIFPDNYFNLIIHNHILEHIPGSYISHISEFHRLLVRGGCMIFTLPIYRDRYTHEDISNNLTDEDRMRLYGQKDHVKCFGSDFLKIFDFFKCKFLTLRNSKEVCDDIAASDPVYCYCKL